MLIPKLTKKIFEVTLRQTDGREIKKRAATYVQFVTCCSTSSKLTKDRYPHVKRGNFNEVTQEHIKFFKSLLGDRILTSESDVEPFNVDWLKMVKGFSSVVLRPKTTEEVSAILKYCNENNLAVCPQGGNTGLVGGSVPVFDEIVLSTSLMNNIISLDVLSGVLTCQSGCILSELDKKLKEHSLIMPLDLGAKDSCQIGGNLSTNAGGIRLIKYGSLQGSVLGLEVVLANGTVLDLLSTLKKDNTGYHLKHLFIGSEGTLGIITKAAIKCPAAPKAINVAFFGLMKFEDVLKTFRLARSELGEIMSSCEVIDKPSLEISLSFTKIKKPVDEDCEFYVLIETSGSNQEHDRNKLEKFIQDVMEKDLVKTGVLSENLSQIQSFQLASALFGGDGTYTRILTALNSSLVVTTAPVFIVHLYTDLWKIRESIPVALLKQGYVFKYDISLPLKNFYEPVTVMRQRLQNSCATSITGYGHIGDGNLHLNITCEKYDQALADLIEPFVFEWTQKLRGSVSAEHGIGFKKTQYLHFSKTDESIRVMKNLKNMFDPKGILNPYKVLPLD